MSRRKRSSSAFLLLFVCLAAAAGTTPAAAQDASIVEAYPDPYADDDTGEYIAIEIDGVETSGWTLSDGEGTTRLPNRTIDSTVYFARGGEPAVTDAERAETLGLRLANSGERVVLSDSSGDVVDELSYGDGGVEPDEGELVFPEGDGYTTRHVGATDLGVLRGKASNVTAFVLPDSPGPVVEAFRGADERVLVSAFTFGSERLVDALRSSEAGVEILVEGSPPGGFPDSTERALRSFDAARRYVADGEESRYRFFHAKYAVVDDAVVVTSENWDGRNFGGNATGSRGWGVVLDSREAAEYLSRVFREDVDWRAVSSWENASVESHERRDGEADVRTSVEPLSENGARYELFVAPDAAVEPVVSLIEEADDEVLVQQAYIRGWDGNLSTNPYVAALRERASAGVDVRVLLDGRWYNEGENREAADALNSSGVEARLSDRPIHTKGVVVDNESVLVSSVNWNENSPTENREVGVVVRDEKVASYFAGVFEDDWAADGADDGVPGGRGTSPTDHLLEALIVLVISGIGVWLVTREI